MAFDEADSRFKTDFIRRTREARERSGLRQQDVADALGIPQDKYKHYEVRTPLPHVHVPTFCRLMRITETWLFTGRERRPAA